METAEQKTVGLARAGRRRETRPIRKALTLVLADGHPIMLEGMCHLLRSQRDFEVVAACTDEERTLDAVSVHRPSVLVLDLRLPHRGGLDVCRDLSRRPLATRVVILADYIADREMLEALRVGVHGVVLKDTAPRVLIECIKHVHRGRTWIENQSFATVIERALRDEARFQELSRRLTRRELEVLHLVAAGLPNKEITTRLAIAEGTVKIHLHNIYGKLGMKGRLQLALCARGEGVIE